MWGKCYLDLMLVPVGFVLSMAYNGWLWHKVRSQPMSTTIGTDAAARRIWVQSMIKGNDKKNVLAVQSLRNAIMESTLMATTSVLLSSGTVTLLSCARSAMKLTRDSVDGPQGEFIKFMILRLLFLSSFICYSLSIDFINQVNFLINIPNGNASSEKVAAPNYVAELLDKGFMLSTVGSRLFYAGLPLLLWPISGPALMFSSSMAMVALLYNLDVLSVSGKRQAGESVQVLDEERMPFAEP